MANAVLNIGQLNDSNKMFLEFLSSGFGRNIFLKNKLKIHLESGQFFHNNIITNKSIYHFLSKQQDETKKELLIEIPSGDDFEVYVRELLMLKMMNMIYILILQQNFYFIILIRIG